MNYICKSKDRCEILGTYMIENNSTVRTAAQHFGISKSTVHKDVTETLKKVNLSLYEAVKCVLEKNKNERHIRGGQATKKKYLHLTKKNKTNQICDNYTTKTNFSQGIK